ncbi:hypothetical protein DL763_009759 [Monosporascus cannonballus]|nr:hypothetical protein DL763_009759 [Monosporascus cannonballus]
MPAPCPLPTVTIGNSEPPQAVNVLPDTGSFELWVNPDCGQAAEPGFCEEFGRYDPALSSTGEDLGQPFETQYGSGATSGTYYRDDIYINNARIRDQQFGVSDRSEVVWFGAMGLAHGLGGSGTDTNGFLEYPGVADSLAAQGFTQSKLFSLDLGGPDPAPRRHYSVQLRGSRTRPPGAAAARPLAGVSLPVRGHRGLGDHAVAPARERRGGAGGRGGYEAPCDYARRDGSVAFELGGGAGGGGAVRIDVRYADFVWDNGDACYLGARYSPDVGVWTLGDTFLRGAYVVFDQDNEALYMANYVSCDGGPDLVPVPAGPDAASNITGACQAAAPLPIASSLRSSSSSPTRRVHVVNHQPHRAYYEPCRTLIHHITHIRAAVLHPTAAGSPAPTTASAGAGNDDGLPGFGGPEATAAPTTTARVTYTSTVTRAEVYTVTVCPPPVRDCPLGQLATRFRAFVTTICTDAPDAVPPTGLPIAAAPIVGVGADMAVEEVTEVQVQVVTSHCSTRTYAVTACAPGDPDCVAGMTTTSVTTVFRTVHAVQTVAVTASVPQVGGKVSAPAPAPVPVQTPLGSFSPGDVDVGLEGAAPTATGSEVPPAAAGGHYTWSASNGSVGGVAAQPVSWKRAPLAGVFGRLLFLSEALYQWITHNKWDHHFLAS